MPEADLAAAERSLRAVLTPIFRGAALEAQGLGKVEDLVRARLAPREADYALVFAPDWVETARAAYAPLWAKTPVPRPSATQSELRLALSTTDRLKAGASNDLAGGMTQIAACFQPGLVVARFVFAEPGAALGTAFDGLVKVGDRWAWFPKPWRALAGAVDPAAVGG